MLIVLDCPSCAKRYEAEIAERSFSFRLPGEGTANQIVPSGRCFRRFYPRLWPIRASAL